jgi:SAM-dependent methyltransferase
LEDLTNAEFWREKWQSSQEVLPRWDLQGEHPLLRELLIAAVAQGRLGTGGKILVPGCGRAHDAWMLSRLGYEVLAIDIAPEAVALGNKLYPNDSRFQLEVGDVFTVGERFTGQHDAVFDRAMLCALNPGRRKQFVASMSQALKTGGLFMSIGFAQIAADRTGPPFGIDTLELQELFSQDFSLVMAEHRKDFADEVILEEILNIWRKI